MQLLTVCILVILTLDSYFAVPYGFLGVRGKKSLMDTPEQYNYDSIEIENPYRFDDETKLLNYLAKNYGRQNYDLDQWNDFHQYEKRVPYGFTGVRGKRSPIKVVPQNAKDDKQAHIVRQY